jgi:hypothetical protein
MSYTREVLSKRHRLSHQQIDHWLGENRSKEFLQEKLNHLKMLRNFIAITDLLRQNEIPFISLKGPLLSQHIYNDPTVRFSHDIDILIDEQQIDSTVKLFLDNGYDFAEGVFWPETKLQQELLIRNTSDLCFYNKEINFCVEVHWTLMNTIPVSQKKMNLIVSENLQEIVFSGRKFTILNRELELLFLLLHGSRHGWERLKWLVDINNYPINQLNIAIFKKLVIEFKAERIIGQTNFLLLRFFNKKLPASINQVQHKRFNIIALSFIESKNVTGYTNKELQHIYHNYYLMFPGFAYKCKIIFKILLRANDIRAIDSRFKIVYYFYRPYSFIKRRIFHA